MTRKPNFWKCIATVVTLSMLFVATWGATPTRLIGAKTAPSNPDTLRSRAANVGTSNVRPSVPFLPSVDVTTVFELDGNAADSPAGAPDDWSKLEGGNGTTGFIIKTVRTAAKGVAIDDIAGATMFESGGSKGVFDIPNWRCGAG